MKSLLGNFYKHLAIFTGPTVSNERTKKDLNKFHSGKYKILNLKQIWTEDLESADKMIPLCHPSAAHITPSLKGVESPVWLDLAKFRHLAKLIKLCQIVKSIFSIFQIFCTYLWQNCYFWANFPVVNDQILKNNLAIWSHWLKRKMHSNLLQSWKNCISFKWQDSST